MNAVVLHEVDGRRREFLTQDDVLREQARLLSVEKRCATRVVHRCVEYQDENGTWREAKF